MSQLAAKVKVERAGTDVVVTFSYLNEPTLPPVSRIMFRRDIPGREPESYCVLRSPDDRPIDIGGRWVYGTKVQGLVLDACPNLVPGHYRASVMVGGGHGTRYFEYLADGRIVPGWGDGD